MAELRLRTIDEAEIETVIGEDIEFHGTFKVDHPTLIKGNVEGNILTNSDIYIHHSAKVDATIEAELLSIRGLVKGRVQTSRRIELFQSGVLAADITTPDLYIQSGSSFNGGCKMTEIEKKD